MSGADVRIFQTPRFLAAWRDSKPSSESSPSNELATIAASPWCLPRVKGLPDARSGKEDTPGPSCKEINKEINTRSDPDLGLRILRLTNYEDGAWHLPGKLQRGKVPQMYRFPLQSACVFPCLLVYTFTRPDVGSTVAFRYLLLMKSVLT